MRTSNPLKDVSDFKIILFSPKPSLLRIRISMSETLGRGTVGEGDEEPSAMQNNWKRKRRKEGTVGAKTRAVLRLFLSSTRTLSPFHGWVLPTTPSFYFSGLKTGFFFSYDSKRCCFLCRSTAQ